MQSTRDLVSHRIEEHLRVMEDLRSCGESIWKIAEVMVQAFQRGNKILIFGNGGSAADAQHMTGELVGRFYRERLSLPALALTVNTSNLTALANDYAYDQVFARQLEALGQPGDVAIAISTSGRSPNVLEALRVAKRKGLATVGLTGSGESPLVNQVDFCLRVPSKDTPRIQEAHITVIHIICELVEEEMFGQPEGPRDP